MHRSRLNFVNCDSYVSLQHAKKIVSDSLGLVDSSTCVKCLGKRFEHIQITEVLKDMKFSRACKNGYDALVYTS